jgi:hypothetical protein
MVMVMNSSFHVSKSIVGNLYGPKIWINGTGCGGAETNELAQGVNSISWGSPSMASSVLRILVQGCPESVSTTSLSDDAEKWTVGEVGSVPGFLMWGRGENVWAWKMVASFVLKSARILLLKVGDGEVVFKSAFFLEWMNVTVMPREANSSKAYWWYGDVALTQRCRF